MRLYDYPLSIVEKFRSRLGKVLSVAFPAVEDFRLSIMDRFATVAAPDANTVEIDLTDDTWVRADVFLIEGDRIDFR